MRDLTYNNIIKLLEKQGQGSKQQVLSMLKTANIDDLYVLRNSIEQQIRVRMIADEEQL